MTFPRNVISKFSPGSAPTKSISELITNHLRNPRQIPAHLGGNLFNGNIQEQEASYCRGKPACSYSTVNKKELVNAITDYRRHQRSFQSDYPPQRRMEMFLEAADLAETKYRDHLIAYTMIGQNKTPYEAEIDAVCELADFWRFNVHYYEQILNKQPLSVGSDKNWSEYNPLNGVVTAVTPFNFTAIGGNLATAPLLFGNCVFWKPSEHAVLSNYLVYEILLEAGFPEYMINFTPMDPINFQITTTRRRELAAVLFTGSCDVFNEVLKDIYQRPRAFNNYPRVIGETGGKNYHFIHNSVNDMDTVVSQTMESAFNYSGQKCSACSRVYIPESRWDEFLASYKDQIEDYKSSQYTYGLIHERAFNRTKHVLENVSHMIVDGGNMRLDHTYYVEPTLLRCDDHNNFAFHGEFFAPILTCYVYDDNQLHETMELCFDNEYALTGAVFSDNDHFTNYFRSQSMNSCGNLYINNKSTGSVVGQQPFGGMGKSGTNDKAGDINLLYRLFSQRNVKMAMPELDGYGNGNDFPNRQDWNKRYYFDDELLSMRASMCV